MNDYSYNRLVSEEKGGTSANRPIDAFLSKQNRLRLMLTVISTRLIFAKSLIYKGK